MSFEEFMSVTEGMPWSYEGWRCVYCGEIIDPLILFNRMKAKAKTEEEGVAAGAKQGGK